MEILEIDRVTVTTPDIDGLEETLSEVLDIEFGDRLHTETETTSGTNKLEITFSELGIELMTARDEESSVAKFIEQNGTGVYALSIRVADIEATKSELAEKDIEPIGEFHTETCSELFYHPRHFDGLFLFFTEYEAGHPAERALSEFSIE